MQDTLSPFLADNDPPKHLPLWDKQMYDPRCLSTFHEERKWRKGIVQKPHRAWERRSRKETDSLKDIDESLAPLQNTTFWENTTQNNVH